MCKGFTVLSIVKCGNYIISAPFTCSAYKIRNGMPIDATCSDLYFRNVEHHASQKGNTWYSTDKT